MKERYSAEAAAAEAAEMQERLRTKNGEVESPKSEEYREAAQDIAVEQEAKERPERLKRLSESVERLFPGDSPALAAVRKKIIDSFGVPQWGEYHNEGMFMDTHLDLILDNIGQIAEGNVPAEVPDDVRATLAEAAKKYGDVLERYTFLHDIAKMDCLRLKYADGTVKEMTWDELKSSLTGGAENDPVAFKEYARQAGIEGVSYYHQGDKKAQKEGRKHGEAGADAVRPVAGIDVPPAVFTAIANHEVAFQFQHASAATYEKYFGSMSDEERDLALTASYVDTVSSLGKDGRPDLKNFVALAHSKRNSEVAKAVAAALAGREGLDPKKTEAAVKSLRDRKDRIAEDAETVVARLAKECRPTEYDEARLAVALEQLVAVGGLVAAERDLVLAAVQKKDISAIGRALGKKMKVVNEALKSSEKNDI